MEVGDKNTSYFHKQAEARKQYKKVTKIQVQYQTITNFESIKAIVANTFEALYTETQWSAIDSKSYPLSLFPSLIQEEVYISLTKAVSQQEIKEALDQMNPDKAPGPCGFTARFFQHSWDIIKSDLTKLISEIPTIQQVSRNKFVFLGPYSERKRRSQFWKVPTNLSLQQKLQNPHKNNFQQN